MALQVELIVGTYQLELRELMSSARAAVKKRPEREKLINIHC
jgi:hypothetical protein